MVDELRVQRRVRGYHDIRMDGATDLVARAKDCSVMDLGCNRGMVGFEFACNGAAIVHGCDHYEQGILTAREVFADIGTCKSQFEVVDLSKGPAAFEEAFRQNVGLKYDFMLMLATYHKLKRMMSKESLSRLVQYLGNRTGRYFVWRGTARKPDENEEELKVIEADLRHVGLRRIHYSEIAEEIGPVCVWLRK